MTLVYTHTYTHTYICTYICIYNDVIKRQAVAGTSKRFAASCAVDTCPSPHPLRLRLFIFIAFTCIDPWRDIIRPFNIINFQYNTTPGTRVRLNTECRPAFELWASKRCANGNAYCCRETTRKFHPRRVLPRKRYSVQSVSTILSRHQNYNSISKNLA